MQLKCFLNYIEKRKKSNKEIVVLFPTKFLLCVNYKFQIMTRTPLVIKTRANFPTQLQTVMLISIIQDLNLL